MAYFYVGWPDAGSFNPQISKRVWHVVSGNPSQLDQFLYIDCWFTLFVKAPPWLKRCVVKQGSFVLVTKSISQGLSRNLSKIPDLSILASVEMDFPLPVQDPAIYEGDHAPTVPRIYPTSTSALNFTHLVCAGLCSTPDKQDLSYFPSQRGTPYWAPIPVTTRGLPGAEILTSLSSIWLFIFLTCTIGRLRTLPSLICLKPSSTCWKLFSLPTNPSGSF